MSNLWQFLIFLGGFCSFYHRLFSDLKCFIYSANMHILFWTSVSFLPLINCVHEWIYWLCIAFSFKFQQFFVELNLFFISFAPLIHCAWSDLLILFFVCPECIFLLNLQWKWIFIIFVLLVHITACRCCWGNYPMELSFSYDYS